jgi:hypothetical protein
MERLLDLSSAALLPEETGLEAAGEAMLASLTTLVACVGGSREGSSSLAGPVARDGEGVGLRR